MMTRRISRRMMWAAAALALAPALGAGTNVWTTNGPNGLSVGALAADPSRPGVVYAGAVTGIFKSTDGGESWASANSGLASAGPVSALAVDPGDFHTLYAAIGGVAVDTTYGTLYKSTDEGASWTEKDTGLPGSAITSLAIDHYTPSRINAGLAGGPFGPQGGIYQSTDGGASWSQVSPSNVEAVAICPVDPAIQFAGSVDGGGILMSNDRGHTWGSVYGGGSNLAVTDIALSPSNPLLAYAIGVGGALPAPGAVLKSASEGASWTVLPENFTAQEITSLAADPTAASTVFVGACDPGGVFRSTDGGASWAPFNAGLSASCIQSLATDSTGTRLYAGARDGNVYVYQIAAGAASCTPDANTLCLNNGQFQNGRFQVQAQWSDHQGNPGLAYVATGISSADSGLMWFFGPDNWELLIKVLNGCGVNGHYWVFGAAATDVEYTIQVTDTVSGTVRTYTNPLGTASPAITDTAAFPSCP